MVRSLLCCGFGGVCWLHAFSNRGPSNSSLVGTMFFVGGILLWAMADQHEQLKRLNDEIQNRTRKPKTGEAESQRK